MKFIGQGFEKLDCEQDRQTHIYRQMRANALARIAFTGRKE